MEQAVKSTVKDIRRGVSSMDFAFVLFILQLVAIIPLASIYKGFFDRDIAVLYIIIVMGCAFYSRRSEKTIAQVNPWRAILSGLMGFFITWLSVIALFGWLLGIEFGSTKLEAVYAVMVMQMLFVAPSEELAFRLIIPDYLESRFRKPGSKLMLAIYSQFGFATFHFAAYQGNLGSMVIAFGIGLMWLFLSRASFEKVPILRSVNFLHKPLGIGFTIGSHAAYNLVLAGVLVWNITGV